MAIINCPECNGSLSSEAPACPHCGKPMRDSAVGAKKSVSFFKYIFIAFVVVIIVGSGLVAAKVFMAGKSNLASMAASTGLSIVTPWTDRAQPVIQNALTGEIGNAIGSSIQKITHPTGKYPNLRNVATNKSDNHLVVVFSVDWQGGIMGMPYTTVVEWRFDENKSFGIKIVSDSALIPIAHQNFQQLEEFFNVDVYQRIHEKIARL